MKKSQAPSKIESVRHSLAHILAMAVLEKFPEAKLGIGPAVENGFYYDFYFANKHEFGHELTRITDSDLPEIEKIMRRIIAQKQNFKGEKVTLAETRKIFKNQPFKLELITDFVKEKKRLTVYRTGDFIDLCRGGHIKNTSEINPEAFKLTSVAGAYWKGSEKNPMLTRVYGVAFETKKELEHYLWQQEEAKKRDHRILGERLKLFTFSEEVGPGLPLWLPNGTIIRDEIEKYAKKVEEEWGYQRVTTPHIAKEDLFKKSGHLSYYAESMYPPMKLDDGNYYLKSMNCPHTHMIYKAEPHSYRELPIRYAEYGTVYRYERSGTLAGLLRVRGLTQNDAHIYCREDQAEDEFLKALKLHEFWYKKVFGINDFYMRLSLPSKDKTKFAGMSKEWDRAVKIVKAAMKKSGLRYEEKEGEAAFYGPKVDFQIKSVIGREESASTNQLDFLATERFGLKYHDKDGKEKPVYVIHRAPLGSHERFIAFLIEHYAGAFPFWLAPMQVAVLPISDDIKKYADEVAAELKKNNIRVFTDDRGETIGKKIRDAEMQKIPYILIVGRREMDSKTVSVRERGGKDLGSMSLKNFCDLIRRTPNF